ncbi:MAG TPA: glycosyltransferase family 87 protein [Candidatus Eremiobacteraceae bacterium]|nr:glycosyltransferase family 87 protein [Candidatus Eremiobacteraceae bacterium]
MPPHTILRQSSILCLAILCAAGMVYYHLCIFVPRTLAIRSAQGFGRGYSFGADFYPIWLTSGEALRHHRDPYAPAMTRQIQIGLFGRPLDSSSLAAPTDYRAFAYPAFADVLFWPSAVLPFSVVRILLALILGSATLFSLFLWLHALGLSPGAGTLALMALLTLTSYIVLEGLFSAQPGLLAGFFLAASVATLVSGRLFLSGSLLALTLIKPQMMALVAAYLLMWCVYRWRARWRFLAGFLFVSLLLSAASLLIWPNWISEWLQVIAGYQQYSTPPLISYLLGGRIGPRLGPFLIDALVIGAIVLAARMREASPTSAKFSLTVSLLLTITVITLLPGHAVYDHIVLLPGILLIALSWPRFAAPRPLFLVLLCVTALVVFWQWICAPVVIALQPVLSPQLFADVILLPIRTAASIPFAVLAILGQMTWRVMHDKTVADQPIRRSAIKN